MRKTEATLEITAAMLKIRAFISREVDAIKAGSQEKSPFDKAPISSIHFKMKCEFLDSPAKDLHLPLTTGWHRLSPSGPQIKQ